MARGCRPFQPPRVPAGTTGCGSLRGRVAEALRGRPFAAPQRLGSRGRRGRRSPGADPNAGLLLRPDPLPSHDRFGGPIGGEGGGGERPGLRRPPRAAGPRERDLSPYPGPVLRDGPEGRCPPRCRQSRAAPGPGQPRAAPAAGPARPPRARWAPPGREGNENKETAAGTGTGKRINPGRCGWERTRPGLCGGRGTDGCAAGSGPGKGRGSGSLPAAALGSLGRGAGSAGPVSPVPAGAAGTGQPGSVLGSSPAPLPPGVHGGCRLRARPLARWARPGLRAGTGPCTAMMGRGWGGSCKAWTAQGLTSGSCPTGGCHWHPWQCDPDPTLCLG